MRDKKAKRDAYSWVQYADQIYIAVRFLWWRGFYREFALFGAHAMELYLKAYLVHKTGEYPVTHELTDILEMCGKHDDFFKNDELVLNIAGPMAISWRIYWHMLRYPESLSDQPDRRYYGWATGDQGTHRILDVIAQHVRETVPRPQGSKDEIDIFINHGEKWLFLRRDITMDDWLENRKWFLHDNPYFASLLSANE